MNRAGAPIQSGIVILAAGGHADDLGLDILGDHPHLFEGKVAVGEACQGSGTGDHQGGGPGNSRSRRRLRVRLHQQAFFRREELQQPRRQREAKAFRYTQRLKTGKFFFAPGIDGAQVNALPFQRRQAAGGENVDCEIYRQRAGMEEIQRPKVDGASRQIGAARSLGDDAGPTGRIGAFSHLRVLPRDGRRNAMANSWNTNRSVTSVASQPVPP